MANIKREISDLRPLQALNRLRSSFSIAVFSNTRAYSKKPPFIAIPVRLGPTKFKRGLASLGLASLGLVGSGLVGSGLAAPAQPPLANGFEPPPNQDAPNSTAGGGSRPAESACAWQASDVNDSGAGDRMASGAIALAPQTFVGRTQRVNPTLWVYTPSSNIETLEISLFDAQLNGIAQTQQSIAGMGGLVPIQLPSVAAHETVSLSPGQPYYWSAAFVCDEQRRTEDWVVGGWIQFEPRVASQTASQAASQTGLQASLQAKSRASLSDINEALETGYWYDALENLLGWMQAGQRTADISAAWRELLLQATISPDHLAIDSVQQSLEQRGANTLNPTGPNPESVPNSDGL